MFFFEQVLVKDDGDKPNGDDVMPDNSGSNENTKRVASMTRGRSGAKATKAVAVPKQVFYLFLFGLLFHNATIVCIFP